MSILRKLMFVSLLSVLPSLASAAAVQIYTLSGEVYWMDADYNVRFTPSPGHDNSYVNTSYNSNGWISVYGRDAVSGNYFYCNYNNSISIRYDAALEYITHLQTNGTTISIERHGTANACLDTNIIRDSREQP